MNDLISVCIPLYNSKDYTVQTIESIINQTYPNVELIICDDCSPDGSYEYILNYVQSLKNCPVSIHLSQNEKNLGMIGNWNHVVFQAHGKYVKIMGGDDLLEKNILEKQYKILSQNPQIGLVVSRKKVINHEGNQILTLGYKTASNFYNSMKAIRTTLQSGGNVIGEPVAGLFRKSDFLKVGGYDSQIYYHADVDLWIRLMLEYESFYYQNEPLYSFRIHKGSVTSSQKQKIFADFQQLFMKYKDKANIPTWLIPFINTKVQIRTILRDWIIRMRA